MSALLWLAIPVLATLVAAVVVPAATRRRGRELTAAQRAARVRRALEPKPERTGRGTPG